jgi:division protein CdvB (Snf7/Vps24/ESCRT-III family)
VGSQGVVFFSLIRRFEDKMHSVPFKERLEHAKFRLQTQYDKLEQTYSRIQQRDKDLFQRCVGAQLSNDPAHARIYANECAEIRKIAKVVLGSQLALERVILRLETVSEFGTIYAEIAPVMGIVKDTRSKIAGVVPQVANELDEVNSLLEDLTVETGEVSASTIATEVSDLEAKKILDETGVIADERLREHFPDLPSIAEHSPTTILEPANTTDNNGDLQEEVYKYAKEHPSFSIVSCADKLGKSPDEIRIAIDKLRDNGKLMIE